MGIRLDKPWQRLDDEAIEALPSQLGVYHVADAGGTVLSVGFAGARELFGMQSALRHEMEQSAPLPPNSGASSRRTTAAAGTSC